MYTPVSTLHDYQKFLEEKLKEENYTLLATPDGNGDGKSEKLIIPPVRVAALPHENFAFTPVGEFYPSAPYICISMDTGDIDAGSRNMQMLIQCCVYSTEKYKVEDGAVSNIPDEQSEIDLLNLLEWIQQKIIEKHKIGGSTIQYPIRMGSYGTKAYTYPKAYGYLSFGVSLIQPPISRDWANKY
ncbi:MAG: hypothetical protein MR945_09155 [Agathobacter sp.]|nr:hypothetical protein [Agathobacter sp.]